MTEMNQTVRREILTGLEQLVIASGTNSRDHGFHEDWPEPDERMEHMPSGAEVKQFQRQVGLAITEKLALIHEEVSEALGEIRDGHAPATIYYRLPDGTISASQLYDDGFPLGKPEGFSIELADAMIRIADLADLTGIDLPAAVIEKHQFNATRPHKHGRKF